MKELIFRQLSQYNHLVAQSDLLSTYQNYYGDKVENETCQYLLLKRKMIECWFLLLTVEELFVIKRHLVDGLDWPRVAVEYSKNWGGEFERSERTLQTYQSNGIKKIIDFSERHHHMTVSVFGSESNVSSTQ